jgi:hypothetical protein
VSTKWATLFEGIWGYFARLGASTEFVRKLGTQA